MTTCCQHCGENVAGLTRREADVVALLASGLSRTQTATCLRISWHTVHRHLVAAMERNGARSCTHLVVMAIRRGWVPWEARQ